MGNQPSLAPGVLVEVGIAKSQMQDFDFQQFFNHPQSFARESYRVLDLLGDVLVFRVFPNLPHDSAPPAVVNIMSDAEWKSQVLDPLRAIVVEAREKRERLRQLMLKNPYLPYQKFLPFKAHRLVMCYDPFEMHSCRDKCFIALILIPMIIYSFTVQLGAILLGLALDLILCRSCCGVSETEIQFLTKLCQENPELDSRATDQVVANKMGEIIISLNARYHQLEFSWLSTIRKERRGSGENSYIEVFDMYLIRITPRNANLMVPV